MARCPRADKKPKVNTGKLCDRHVSIPFLKSGSHMLIDSIIILLIVPAN